jgi:hypothetical protein
MKRTLATACVLTAMLLITLALVVAAAAEAVVMHTMPPAQFDVPYLGKLTIWTYASSKDLRAVQSNAAEGNSDKGLKNAHWGGWAFASLPKNSHLTHAAASTSSTRRCSRLLAETTRPRYGMKSRTASVGLKTTRAA